MTDEEKYYTPELEELYLGFECEIQSQDLIAKTLRDILDQKLLDIPIDEFINVFEKHLITATDIQMYSLNPHLLKTEIKVKKLDKEDIESLGWKFDAANMFYSPKGRDICLKLGPNRITISLGEHSMMFCIKNKSQLKKLMNQLGFQI